MFAFFSKMEETTDKLSINVSGLIGKLKKLKENAYEERKRKEKEKYEKKKLRERLRYHENKLKMQKPNETGSSEEASPGCSSWVINKSLQSDNNLHQNLKSTKEKKSVKETKSVKGKKSSTKMSVEEKRRKEREKKRKQREKIKQDPEKHAAFLQKEKEIYRKRKAAGKIKLIENLTLKEKKRQRKQWKKNQRNHRAAVKEAEKIREYIEQISPPPTPEPVEDEEGNLRIKIGSRHNSQERKKISKDKAKTYKELKSIKKELLHQRRKSERYKKRYQRMLLAKETNTPSPNTKVSQILKRGDEKEVKRKLLFGEVLERQIKDNVQRSTTQKQKQTVANVISGKTMKKYQLTKEVNRMVSTYRYRKAKSYVTISPQRKKKIEEKIKKLKADVEIFFTNDLNSIQAPGKKDFITFKQKNMQKRFLKDTLQNLHKKFIEQHYKLSFA